MAGAKMAVETWSQQTDHTALSSRPVPWIFLCNALLAGVLAMNVEPPRILAAPQGEPDRHNCHVRIWGLRGSYAGGACWS